MIAACLLTWRSSFYHGPFRLGDGERMVELNPICGRFLRIRSDAQFGLPSFLYDDIDLYASSFKNAQRGVPRPQQDLLCKTPPRSSCRRFFDWVRHNLPSDALRTVCRSAS